VIAIAAGLSVRRGPVSSEPNAGLPPAWDGSVADATLVGGTPPALPGAAVTSPPFVTTSGTTKKSKSKLFATLGAAVLGLSVGVVAILKLASGHPPQGTARSGTTSMAASPPGSSSPSAAGSLASSAPIESTSAIATASAATGPQPRSNQATTKPTHGGATPPVRTASNKTTPPLPTSQGGSADPGY
jgi:hypothetical protein